MDIDPGYMGQLLWRLHIYLGWIALSDITLMTWKILGLIIFGPLGMLLKMHSLRSMIIWGLDSHLHCL